MLSLSECRALLHTITVSGSTQSAPQLVRMALNNGVCVGCKLDESGTFVPMISPRNFDALSLLVAAGYFTILPSTTSGGASALESTTGTSGGSLCDAVEPVAAAVLLFAELFCPNAVSDSPSSLASSVVQSADSSVDYDFAGPPRAERSNVDAGALTCDEASWQAICDARSSLVLELLASVDGQLRLAHSRVITTEHRNHRTTKPTDTNALSSGEKGKARASGVADVIALHTRLIWLYQLKMLLLASFTVSSIPRTHFSFEASQNALKELLGDQLFQCLTTQPLGSLGLDVAALATTEKLADEVASRISSALKDANLLPLQKVQSIRGVVAPQYMSLLAAGEQSTPTLVLSALSIPFADVSRVLPQLFGGDDTSDLISLAPLGASPFLFNTEDSTFTSLISQALVRKLTQSQRDAISDKLLKGDGHSRNQRRLILDHFLRSFPERIGLVAEKNKDLLVDLVSKALVEEGETGAEGGDTSSLREFIISSVMALPFGEPSCHIVKKLYDDNLLVDDDLSKFTSLSIRSINSLGSDAASQQRAQRNAMMLCLTIQNTILAKKNIPLATAAEVELLSFCLQFNSVKACAELYNLITGLRKVLHN